MNSLDETADLTQEEVVAQFFTSHKERPFHIEAGGETHVGNVRKENEDHFAIVRGTRHREILQTNLSLDNLEATDDVSFGMIVADGVGGSAAGGIASKLVIETMFDLASRVTTRVKSVANLNEQDLFERVDAYVSEVQKTILHYSKTHSEHAGMGSTWTSLHIFGPHAIVVHLGDSRAYLYRDGEMHQITRDQTAEQRLLEEGVDEEKARKFRHVLLNSFGGTSENVYAAIYHFRIHSGDRVLLCTDGLSDMLKVSEMEDVLATQPDPQRACSRLVHLALQAGGRDNITVTLCNIEEPR